MSAVLQRWKLCAGGLVLLAAVYACAVTSGRYVGGVYEAPGYFYGEGPGFIYGDGWGPRYHVGPPRGGDRGGTRGNDRGGGGLPRGAVDSNACAWAWNVHPVGTDDNYSESGSAAVRWHTQ
jgi:hypothetical protein